MQGMTRGDSDVPGEDLPERGRMLAYGRRPSPPVSANRKIVGWTLIGCGAAIMAYAMSLDVPPARANITLVGIWFILPGLYLRFRRSRS